MNTRLTICEVYSQKEYLSEKKIKEVLKRHKENVTEYAYILHNKDEETKEHWHLMIKLKNPTSISQIAKWFDLDEQYIRKSTSKSEKKYKFDDMLAYLIHRGQEDKYQYSINEVKTNIPNIGSRIEDYNLRQILIEKTSFVSKFRE